MPGSSPDDNNGERARTTEGSAGADGPRQRSVLWPFLSGVFATLCAAALGLFLANRAGYISEFAVFQTDDERPFVIPAQDVVFARSFIPSLLDAVGKAQERLETDPDSITAADGTRFRPFRQVFPDLWETVPHAAKRRVAISVRKDGSAYKLLLTGGICPLVTASGAIAKDARREGAEGFAVLCSHFSLWNEAGRNF